MIQVIINAVVALPIAKYVVVQALAQVAMKVIIYIIVNVIDVIHLVFPAVAQQIHAQAV